MTTVTPAVKAEPYELKLDLFGPDNSLGRGAMLSLVYPRERIPEVAAIIARHTIIRTGAHNLFPVTEQDLVDTIKGLKSGSFYPVDGSYLSIVCDLLKTGIISESQAEKARSDLAAWNIPMREVLISIINPHTGVSAQYMIQAQESRTQELQTLLNQHHAEVMETEGCDPSSPRIHVEISHDHNDVIAALEKATGTGQMSFITHEEAAFMRRQLNTLKLNQSTATDRVEAKPRTGAKINP